MCAWPWPLFSLFSMNISIFSTQYFKLTGTLIFWLLFSLPLKMHGFKKNFFVLCWSVVYWQNCAGFGSQSVRQLSRVWLFAIPWTTACQASLSITNSRSLLKLMSIKSVMPSNHLILCHPHLLLASMFPSTRVFSNESVLRIMWPKYWSFSFSISPSNKYSGLISFRNMHPDNCNGRFWE